MSAPAGLCKCYITPFGILFKVLNNLELWKIYLFSKILLYKFNCFLFINSSFNYNKISYAFNSYWFIFVLYEPLY